MFGHAESPPRPVPVPVPGTGHNRLIRILKPSKEKEMGYIIKRKVL